MIELHICLWGEDNFKNYTPLLIQSSKAQLLVLGDISQEADIKRSLANANEHPFILEWPTNAQPADFSRLENFLKEINAKNILLNLSTGSRLTALQLFQWAALKDIECYLIDENDYQQWLIPNDRPSQAVADLASLKAYFRVHQIKLLSHGLGIPITKEPGRLVEMWIQPPSLYPLFRSLNRLANSAINNDKFTHSTAYDAKLDNHWRENQLFPLLLDLQEHNLAQCDHKTVAFTNEACRFFCNGGWLEFFVYEQVRRLKTKMSQIQDVRLGLEVSYKEDIKNELDVVFLADNQLYLIEVKTSYLADKIVPANQMVYKLEALSNALGEEVKGMIVTLSDLPIVAQRRAGLYDLEVVSGSQLRHLSSRLKQWIEGE
ncbi:Card1-like endonuclease domain-containing protein [Marinomonas sp.]|uniref:Card1-like endonuclease domain-containing protein n=1 Tax=Marinomonas sp. TaxID=1904862 RepID=UPI003BAC6A50